MRRWLGAAFLVVLLLVAAGAAGLWLHAKRRYDAPGPLPEARAIVVPHGALAELGAALTQAGLVDDALEFRLAALATAREGPLHAAELAFPAHASLRTVLAILRTGRPVQHRLTIPEGLTAIQITALLTRAEALSGAVPPLEEAEVLPESYAYEYATPRAAIVERAARDLQRMLANAWAGRSQGLPLGTPQEALTLASLVERETARPEERAHVAAVFLNRLRAGMKLQSDPTVVYAVSNHAGTLDRRLTRADLDRDDPYNTYRIAGLPPGPICAPGQASIRAVVNPALSDDLYFVADGTGGHVFARTLEEHQRNVARWRARTAPEPATGPH